MYKEDIYSIYQKQNVNKDLQNLQKTYISTIELSDIIEN